MILCGRFIGAICNKAITSAGVLEIDNDQPITARVMLTVNVLPGLTPGDCVKVTWPDGRIISFTKPARPAPVIPGRLRRIYKKIKAWRLPDRAAERRQGLKSAD